MSVGPLHLRRRGLTPLPLPRMDAALLPFDPVSILLRRRRPDAADETQGGGADSGTVWAGHTLGDGRTSTAVPF